MQKLVFRYTRKTSQTTVFLDGYERSEKGVMVRRKREKIAFANQKEGVALRSFDKISKEFPLLEPHLQIV